jgi:hypothetical protein
MDTFTCGQCGQVRALTVDGKRQKAGGLCLECRAGAIREQMIERGSVALHVVTDDDGAVVAVGDWGKVLHFEATGLKRGRTKSGRKVQLFGFAVDDVAWRGTWYMPREGAKASRYDQMAQCKRVWGESQATAKAAWPKPAGDGVPPHIAVLAAGNDAYASYVIAAGEHNRTRDAGTWPVAMPYCHPDGAPFTEGEVKAQIVVLGRRKAMESDAGDFGI